MRFKSWKSCIWILVIVSFVLCAPLVKAADIKKMIEVAYANIPIMIDGKAAKFDYEPLFHNGVTYVPIRGISKHLGREIYYDQKNHTVYVYTKGNEPEAYRKEMEAMAPQILEPEFVFQGITIGDTEETLLAALGNPGRKDASEYGFEWYIYNADYQNYLQVGVKNRRVVGLYTNSNYWRSKQGIEPGMIKAEVNKILGSPVAYIEKGNTRYKVDAIENQTDTYLIGGGYVTIFYDIYSRNAVTAVQIIQKDMEHGLKGFYGKSSEALQISYERQLFDLANSIRVRNGLEPYIWEDRAAEAAKAHSKDMAENQFFAHVNTKDQDVTERLREQASSFRTAEENIAAGQTSAIFAHEAWLNSVDHRKVILGASKYMGAGVFFGGQYNIYYTQIFGTY